MCSQWFIQQSVQLIRNVFFPPRYNCGTFFKEMTISLSFNTLANAYNFVTFLNY